MERAFEVRNHGRTRADDEAAISHFQWPEKTDGTHIGQDPGEFRRLLERYYELRGWDKATGWPTREKLEELGLEDVAEELRRHGTLP